MYIYIYIYIYVCLVPDALGRLRHDGAELVGRVGRGGGVRERLQHAADAVLTAQKLTLTP